MFEPLFHELRAEGVPVALDEWLALQEALRRDLAGSSLAGFYLLARAMLIKSERHYDAYDVAFSRYFSGLEPAEEEISDRVWEWLRDRSHLLDLSPQDRARLDEMIERMDMDEMRRRLEERLRAQEEAHHGGSRHVGTGGTSPFGHSGYHPGGIRIGGESGYRTAAQVAAERRWRDYRTDETLDVRQFGVALRRLRRLSTAVAGPAAELDLDGTIQDTADHGGQLRMRFRRPRRNAVRVLVLFDVGGSMDDHIAVCDRLFSAVHAQSHFRELHARYFHNCVYDRLYLGALMDPHRSDSTLDLLARLSPETKLILVGDGCMAPSELALAGGAIDYWQRNEEPGYVWLERLAAHFTHTVWLNPVPEAEWEVVHGARTLNAIRTIFPMHPLSVEGLEAAVRELMVRR
jgi:hypothetical protein